MFKVSQEIRLNINPTTSHTDAARNSHHHHHQQQQHNNSGTDNDCIFGKYQRTPDADAYPVSEHLVFVAPELTDTSKVQLLHFPSGVVKINTDVNFVIKRNGLKGNFEVKLESPTNITSIIPLQIVDPERFAVGLGQLTQAGLYKVHIKCNSVALPKSPFIIATICGDTLQQPTKMQMPVFESNAAKVHSRGLGLTHICLNEKNEFTIDGSEAGNNILFVGIFGPNGQCDEVVIKHMGKNIYKVTYEVQDPGDYILAAKWGDEHIPGSPFYLSAM